MGGKSQPAPDYGPMQQLGREQLDFAKQQYAELKPLAEKIAASQIAAQEEQMNQARDYYDYQQKTFRPLEKGLVADAERFNTEGYREQIAKDAGLQAARAFAGTQAMGDRAAAARGISVDSPAALAMRNRDQYALATTTAQMKNNARTQAEQMGYARKLDAAGLGRGLAGASSAAYGGATAAGTSGINTRMAPGTQFGQGMAQTGNTFGNILNNQTSQFNAGLNAEGQIMGALVGAGTTAAFKYSDRRLKTNIEMVGRDERTMLPLYEFEYINGSGRRFMGVMADDVEQKFPDMVYDMPDGYKAVNYAGLGIEMVEV